MIGEMKASAEHVRKAGRRDIARVAVLWTSITDHHRELDPLFTMREGSEGELHELLAALQRDPDAEIFVYDEGGETEGMLIVRISSAPPILEETERVARESAEGQAMELGWRRDNVNELSESDYLEMVLKKTCWFGTIFPSRVGAMIGTRNNIGLDQFVKFGFFLGAAFQIQDDLLNLVADKRYGKERDGDIWEGKRTLMLIRLFDISSAEEKTRLNAIMSQSRTDRIPADIEWIRGLMDRYGCIEYARKFAHGLAGAAAHEYNNIYENVPDSRDKRFIEGLVTWIFERT